MSSIKQRENKRGKAREGIITGIKEGCEGIEKNKEIDGLVGRKVEIDKEIMDHLHSLFSIKSWRDWQPS